MQCDDNGVVLGVLERKPEVRRIKIKTLTADRNMAQLASDIVDKCKYIHPSRVEEIEQLLIKLRKHVLANPDSGKGGDDNSAADSTDRDRERGGRDGERRSGNGSSGTGGASRQAQGIASNGGGKVFQREPPPEERPRPVVDLLPPASMQDLDDYLEMLYQVSGKSEKEREEGLKLQVSSTLTICSPSSVHVFVLLKSVAHTLLPQERGTGMILKLCRDVMNLEQLIQNSTVMGALTRVLQEEYKKSVELTFNILRLGTVHMYFCHSSE